MVWDAGSNPGLTNQDWLVGPENWHHNSLRWPLGAHGQVPLCSPLLHGHATPRIVTEQVFARWTLLK
jgi:hypothetical protein